MQIFIRISLQRTIVLEVEGNDTIASVKLKIQEQEEIPVALQRLVFSGVPLADDRTLADYGIQKESTLHLIVMNAQDGAATPVPALSAGSVFALSATLGLLAIIERRRKRG
ncbi:MAG: hypothetical protein IT523_05340 [Burkholderiales bacterium]|nr:hypothetical protein [Burkholderiales bacterium]